MNRTQLRNYINNWNKLLTSYFCEEAGDYLFLDSMSLKIKHANTSESVLFYGRNNHEIVSFVEGVLKTHWVLERKKHG